MNRDIKTGRFTASYETYVKEYKKKQDQLNRMGYYMDDEMYTERQWKAAYQLGKLEARGRGEKFSNRALVDEQAYRFSKAQVQAYINVTEGPFHYVSRKDFNKLRLGESDQVSQLLEETSEEYWRLREEYPNLSTGDLSRILATQFWGSK